MARGEDNYLHNQTYLASFATPTEAATTGKGQADESKFNGRVTATTQAVQGMKSVILLVDNEEEQIIEQMLDAEEKKRCWRNWW